MDRAQLEDLVVRFTDAFNRDDLDGVMAFFAEDGIYDEFTGVRSEGKDAIRAAFAPQFAGYGDTRFRVGTVHKVENRDQYIVSSTITPPGKDTEVHIDWRLLHRDGRFKVLDIVGEGVSMALTLRAEYGSVLKNSAGKVDKLIVLLRERIGLQAAAN